MKFYKISFLLFINNIFSETDSSKFSKSECHICPCSVKDGKIKKKEEIIKEKTVKDIDLDKNIPGDFIKNNKERVSKMIKVFNKGFNEDIDEILLLLYNINKTYEHKSVIKKYFWKKFIKEEKQHLIIVNINRTFYIFKQDSEEIEDTLFPGEYYTYTEYHDKEGFHVSSSSGSSKIYKLESLLYDIFYVNSIEKNKQFPSKILNRIIYFFIYDNFDGYYSFDTFVKDNNTKINYILDKNCDIFKEFSIFEKPVKIYLNIPKFKDNKDGKDKEYDNADINCYKIDKEEDILPSEGFYQFILTISSENIEIKKI